MSSSAHKNRDTVGDSETIFDFLKRKQQFNLQNTISKSLHQSSATKRKHDVQIEQDFPQTRDLTKYHTQESNRYAYTARQSITPRKLEFQNYQGQQLNQHRKTKSFLSMISPVKNRSSSQMEDRNQSKQRVVDQRSATKISKNVDKYTHKNVNRCINDLKDTLYTLNGNIKKIQEKSRGLSVLFIPFFNFIENSDHHLARQTGDLKNKLRSFETIIESAYIDNCDDLLETFHQTLEEHLQCEIYQRNLQGERQRNQTIQKLKKTKDSQIAQLESELKKAYRQNEIIARKLEKQEGLRLKIQQDASQRKMVNIQQLERVKNNSEKLLQELRDKNAALESKLTTVCQQLRESQKNYKDQRILRQTMQEKHRLQMQEVSEAKEAYLLNEIMVLKSQFNADMARMNELHRLKQAELQGSLLKRDEELIQKAHEKGCDKQMQSKLLEEANRIKKENMQLRAKSECIITDMYRLNEELYQHWTALKDIKMLSTRLGSFSQYRKIYDDLLFNEHLFH